MTAVTLSCSRIQYLWMTFRVPVRELFLVL